MDETLKYRLLNSAPEAVYDVLKTHYEYLSWARGYIEDTENQLQKKFAQYEYKNVNFGNVELELLKLSIPLINLALAQFGSNIEVLNALFYDKKIDAYRKACLSNFNFVDDTWYIYFTKEDLDAALNNLEKLICSLDKFEMILLLENPGLSSLVLKRLYSRTGFFESLTQTEWESLIYISSNNPSISKIVSSHEMLSERSCYKEAWELLNTVSVEVNMASALYRILNKAEITYNLPFDKLMKKWTSVQSIESEYLDDDLESEYLNEDKEFFLPLRVVIYKTHQIPYNPNDIAMRCANYTKFLCEDLIQFEIRYRKDGYLFLEYVCQNEWLSEWSFDVLCALEEKIGDNIKLLRMMNKTLLGEKTLQDKALTLIKIDKYIKEQKDTFKEIKSAAVGTVIYLVFVIVMGFLAFSGVKYILHNILQII